MTEISTQNLAEELKGNDRLAEEPGNFPLGAAVLYDMDGTLVLGEEVKYTHDFLNTYQALKGKPRFSFEEALNKRYHQKWKQHFPKLKDEYWSAYEENRMSVNDAFAQKILRPNHHALALMEEIAGYSLPKQAVISSSYHPDTVDKVQNLGIEKHLVGFRGRLDGERRSPTKEHQAREVLGQIKEYGNIIVIGDSRSDYETSQILEQDAQQQGNYHSSFFDVHMLPGSILR